MNIKRPSESWEILSDGLWFDWKELLKRLRACLGVHTRFDASYGLLYRLR